MLRVRKKLVPLLLVNGWLRLANLYFKGVRIGWGSWIKCEVSIGFGTGIGWGFIARGFGSLTIGRYSAIGEKVTVVTSNHDTNTICINFKLQDHLFQKRYLAPTRDVVVGDDVWIGDNAIILAGARIGDGAVVAAGSVVTRDVPRYSLVGGNPAKVIGSRLSPQAVNKLDELGLFGLDLDTMARMRGGFSQLQSDIRDSD